MGPQSRTRELLALHVGDRDMRCSYIIRVAYRIIVERVRVYRIRDDSDREGVAEDKRGTHHGWSLVVVRNKLLVD